MRYFILLFVVASAGCITEPAPETPCPISAAVAVDIDGTLTLSNNEFLSQLQDETYTPLMRPDANTLLQHYADKGYKMAYVTGRGTGQELPDGTRARRATQEWLDLHNFPTGPLYLHDGPPASAEQAVDYKSGALEELQAKMYRFEHAYGDTPSDIEAFINVGIPNDEIYMIGRPAGALKVQEITDEDAYTNHLAEQSQALPIAPCD